MPPSAYFGDRLSRSLRAVTTRAMARRLSSLSRSLRRQDGALVVDHGDRSHGKPRASSNIARRRVNIRLTINRRTTCHPGYGISLRPLPPLVDYTSDAVRIADDMRCDHHAEFRSSCLIRRRAEKPRFEMSCKVRAPFGTLLCYSYPNHREHSSHRPYRI